MGQISDYTDILSDILYDLGALWMAAKFCKRHLEASKRNELLFMAVSFGAYLILGIVNRRYAVPHIFLAVLGHMLFMGLVLLLFGGGWEKRILAASMAILVIKLPANILVSFLSCLTLFFQHAVRKIPHPVIDDWEAVWIVCVSLGLVIPAALWLSKRLTSVFNGKPGKWYVMLAIPLLIIITVFDVAEWGACNGIMVRSGGNMGLYYDQIFSHTEFCILAVIFISAAGFYVFGMNQIYLEQEKSGQYHSQVAVYRMLTEEYRQSERLRHDMKNHIIAISGLFQNKEWEKLGNYLEAMEDKGLEPHRDLTGNTAVDALLYQKQNRAEREKIKWECDVRIPEGCCINEFDLCVLFGNLLDNALKACDRLGCAETYRGECRFINIQAKAVKKCFLIEVRNSMDVAEKPHGNGIGLQNVRDVADKYNGVMDIEAEGGIFVISVLVPLTYAVHDIRQAV